MTPPPTALDAILASLFTGTAHVVAADGQPASGVSLAAPLDQLSRAVDVDGSRPVLAISVADGPLAFAAVAAAMHIGTAAPLSTRLTAAELARDLHDLRPQLCAVPVGIDVPLRAAASAAGIPIVELSLDGEGIVRDPLGRNAPDDIALLLRTSGTTGRPKTVPLTHGNLSASVRSVGAALGLTAEDRLLGVMPLFHIHGIVTSLAAVAAGGTLIATPGFRSDEFVRWLEGSRATWYSAVPTMHQAVLGVTSDRSPSHVLRLIRSSSAAMPSSVHVALEERFGVPVVEAYGMTEAAHQVCSNPVDIGGRRVGTVGRAAGPEVRILSEGQIQDAAGTAGEVVIRGNGVMRGYLDNDDANREAFIEGWFRTGDEGVLDADGHLRLTGRLKEIINKGGEKVAPREVDEALLSHEAVRQAATFGMPHPTYGEEVAAAVVLRTGETVDAIELQRHVASLIADYKVPRRIVIVDQIPLGPTGKIQRRELAEQLGLDRLAAGSRAPDERKTAAEAAVAGIWSNLLGLDAIGLDDDFFAIGGDSLRGAQMLQHLSEVFGVEMPLRVLFGGGATVRALVPEIERARSIPLAPKAASGDDRSGLSAGEERILFLSDLEVGTPIYNVALGLKLPTGRSTAEVAGALQQVADRHEALRTSFPRRRGVRSRSVAETIAVPFEVLDEVGGLEPADGPVREFVRRPHDLDRGPLIRALYCLVQGEPHLVLAMHHAIIDGWSHLVVARDLWQALEVGSLGEAPVAVRQVLGQIDRDRPEDLEYWRKVMADATALPLPTDYPRPAQLRFDGARQALHLDAATTATIERLARASSTTTFAVLLAAFDIVLARYTASDDIVVGVATAGRNVPGLDETVGLFVNMLPVRVRVPRDASFRTLLDDAVRPALEGALEHQAVGYEQLVSALQPERLRNSNPLFQVMAQVRPYDKPGVALERVEVSAGTAKLDLSLEISPVDGGLRCSLEFSTELFDPRTATRLLEMLRRCLEQVVGNPDCSLSTLDLVGDADRDWLRAVAERPAAPPIPGRNVFDAVRISAQRHRGRVAVSTANTTLTYEDVVDEASHIASGLLRVVEPGSAIGVLLERDQHLIPVVLGILGAGCAYVPLDPGWPAPRMEAVMRVAELALVVSDRMLGTDAIPVATADQLSACPIEPLPEVHEDALAYVLHTSGSTGVPKGVEITHSAVLNLLSWARSEFSEAETSNVLVSTALTFDLSVFEILLPLVGGGRATLVENALALADNDVQPTLLNTVPSACEELVRLRALPTSVRTVCLAGEPLDAALVNKLFDLGHVSRVLNLYGPTEATVYCTRWEADPHAPADQVRIGTPIPGTSAYLADEALGLAVPGALGEILIGGGGLARGYRGAPDLTRERFIEAPRIADGRLYRTGDFGRLSADGAITYHGRRDHQVKVRGHRIELGEIEAALRVHQDVAEVVVIVEQLGERDGRLVAYVAPGHLSATALRRHCREHLPPYMVPSSFVALPRLPRNASGKVDRSRLPGSARATSDRPGEEARQPTAKELRILALWRRLLPSTEVRINDDFFELGGHSLLAARMIAELEHDEGLRLSLSTMFTGPATIERIAAVAEPVDGDDLVVVISDQGDRRPLFVVCADESSMLSLRALPKLLGGVRPIVGLLPQREGRRFSRKTTIEQLSEELLPLVIERGGPGPFLLAGHSFGGLLAYHLAVLLERAGHQVTFLGLLDSASGEVMRRGQWWRRGRRLLAEGLSSAGPRIVHFARKRLAARRGDSASISLSAHVANWEVDLEGAFHLMRKYHEPPFAGRVDLFVTRELSDRFQDDLLGWGRVDIGELIPTEVDGGHLSMLQAPHVASLGQLLRERLDDIDAST